MLLAGSSDARRLSERYPGGERGQALVFAPRRAERFAHGFEVSSNCGGGLIEPGGCFRPNLLFFYTDDAQSQTLCRLRQDTAKHLALGSVDERMRFQNAGQLRQLLAGAEQQAASADSRAGGLQFVDDSAHAKKGEIGGTLHALRDQFFGLGNRAL